MLRHECLRIRVFRVITLLFRVCKRLLHQVQI